MDRISRSALFPLIVIVLLVYLASQTLLTDEPSKTKVPYSRVVQTVRNDPASIDRVVLRENRGVVVERADGTRWTASNPSGASQIDLERMLIARNVTYDWESTTQSAWWELITSLVPFGLLIAFFLFLQSRKDERVRFPGQASSD